MGKLFGTDGVRGVAGQDLSPELAMQIGRSAAYVLTGKLSHRPKFLIGKDTRISGDMLESALAAGLCSVGADVELLGVVPTPAVARMVQMYGADAGVVISASHNPVEFNGIKIFKGDGYKLPDEIENEIEKIILEDIPVELSTGAAVGRVSVRRSAIDDYVEYLAQNAKANLQGLNVAFDCANGASSAVAQKLFVRLGANCTFIGAQPDGTNINDGCGSTHLDKLAKFVVENKLDAGIAFDGDADRCLAVDELGQEIDGDKIIAILATDMKEKGELPDDTAVVTVMSNLGFMEFMRGQGMKIATTAVGDRYVLEEMREHGYGLGGEQSGHVILLNHSTTGDGELTASHLLNVLAEKKCKMSQLNGIYTKFPQVLINIEANAAQKLRFKDDEYIQGFIESQQQTLMGLGRVLVRVSGTEPLIRVMVEGKNEADIARSAEMIANKIKDRFVKA
ncbi:MAG: phosphoglucosamine mutase [Oscillospiraceae bacterium]|nr:phosphoglucosamine mutase [Oscillospiraceae bacterium]